MITIEKIISRATNINKIITLFAIISVIIFKCIFIQPQQARELFKGKIEPIKLINNRI